MVDDSEIFTDLMAEAIRSDRRAELAGIARNGREAVEMAKKLQPDVISMDIHMPVMDGFEATQEIMIVRPTPIVAVSASTSVHETQTAMQVLQAGALAVRLKPPGPRSPDFDQAARDLIDTLPGRTWAGIGFACRRMADGSTTSTHPAMREGER